MAPKAGLQACGGNLAKLADGNCKDPSNIRGGLKGKKDLMSVWLNYVIRKHSALTIAVPEMTLVADGLPIHADKMFTPGAKTVT